MAAINETAFLDAVHQSLAMVRALLQVRLPATERPSNYHTILLKESHPASFQAYIGVFGKETPALARTRPAATRRGKGGKSATASHVR